MKFHQQFPRSWISQRVLVSTVLNNRPHQPPSSFHYSSLSPRPRVTMLKAFTAAQSPAWGAPISARGGCACSVSPYFRTIPSATRAQLTPSLWTTLEKVFSGNSSRACQLASSEPPFNVFLSALPCFVLLASAFPISQCLICPLLFYTAPYQNICSWEVSSSNWGDTTVCHGTVICQL